MRIVSPLSSRVVDVGAFKRGEPLFSWVPCMGSSVASTSSPLEGAAATSSEITLSSSNQPSNPTGSPPSVAVPASGWVRSIQTRISTSAASQGSLHLPCRPGHAPTHGGAGRRAGASDRRASRLLPSRSIHPGSIHPPRVAFTRGALLFKAGADGPESALPGDWDAEEHTVLEPCVPQ